MTNTPTNVELSSPGSMRVSVPMGNDTIGVTIPIPEAPGGPGIGYASTGGDFGPSTPPSEIVAAPIQSITTGINDLTTELCWCWETIATQLLQELVALFNDVRYLDVTIFTPIVNTMIEIGEELGRIDQSIRSTLQSRIYDFEELLVQWENDHAPNTPQTIQLPGHQQTATPGLTVPIPTVPTIPTATIPTNPGRVIPPTSGSPPEEGGGGLRTPETIGTDLPVLPVPIGFGPNPHPPSYIPTYQPGETPYTSPPVPPIVVQCPDPVVCPVPPINIYIGGSQVTVEGGNTVSTVNNETVSNLSSTLHTEETTTASSSSVNEAQYNEEVTNEDTTYYTSYNEETTNVLGGSEPYEPTATYRTTGADFTQYADGRARTLHGVAWDKTTECYPGTHLVRSDPLVQRMSRQKTIWIDLGRELIFVLANGKLVPTLAFDYILRTINLLKGGTLRHDGKIAERWGITIRNAMLTDNLDAWYRSSHITFPALWQEQAPLLALRQLLGLFKSVTISSQENQFQADNDTRSGGSKAGAALGGSFVVGHAEIGKETDVKIDQASSIVSEQKLDWSYNAFIVASIELLDWFIAGANKATAPSVSDCIAATMRGGMSDEEMRCWLDLWGCDLSAWQHVVDSAREQLDTTSIVNLWRRGILDDDDFVDRMRAVGWTKPSEIGEVAELATELPGPADIIRFMLRDVEDPAIVDTFGLDAAFNDKFQGLSVYYAKAQGLSEDLMRRYWRAHWDIPSPTQLYTMLQRLRPDRNGYREKGLQVERAEVKLALIQDDILPFWEDRLIEIAYHPLTRTDCRRMYFFGVLHYEELIERYQDVGYNRDDATVLADFQRVSKADWLSQRQEAKAYLDGVLSRAEFRKRLDRYNVTDDDFNEVLTRLLHISRRALRKKCIAAMRKQYMHGGIRTAEVVERLGAYGYEADRVNDILESWHCERESQDKTIPATMLCKWFKEGLLSRKEFMERLITVGYAPRDAANVVFICDRDMVREKDKKAKTEREKDEREERRLINEARRADERRTRDAEKFARELERSEASVDKALATLRKEVIKSADKNEVPVEVMTNWAAQGYQEILVKYRYPYGAANLLIIDAVRSFEGNTEDEFIRWVEQLILADEQLIPPDTRPLPPSS